MPATVAKWRQEVQQKVYGPRAGLGGYVLHRDPRQQQEAAVVDHALQIPRPSPSSQPTQRSRTAMRHAGLENCKMGPSASEMPMNRRKTVWREEKSRTHRLSRRTRPRGRCGVPHRDVDAAHGGGREVELHLGATDKRDPLRHATCTVPKSSSRACPGGARAGAAATARHQQPPRPDRRTPPGCIDRGVLAGACASIPGPVGAAPVRGRSRASAELRANRERLWPQRRRPRPPHGAPGRGNGAVGHGSHRSTLPPPPLRIPDQRTDPDRLERLTGTVEAPVQAASTAGGAQRDPEGTSR